jgi:hypothetical protein
VNNLPRILEKIEKLASACRAEIGASDRPLDAVPLEWLLPVVFVQPDRRANWEQSVAPEVWERIARLTKASLFRDHLIRSEPALAEKILGRPFWHIETISRICRLDENKARDLIEGRDPNTTFRDLYNAYENVTKVGRGIVPVMAGKKAAKQFRGTAIALFKKDQSRLFGSNVTFEVEIMRPVVPFRYSSPDGYIVCRKNNKVTRIEAVDCYALYNGSQAEIALRKMIPWRPSRRSFRDSGSWCPTARVLRPCFLCARSSVSATWASS